MDQGNRERMAFARWMFNRGIQHAIEMIHAKAKVQKALASIEEGRAIDMPTVNQCMTWAKDCQMDEEAWKQLTDADEPVPIGQPRKEPHA